MKKILHIFVVLVLILLVVLSSGRAFAVDSPLLKGLVEPNSIVVDHQHRCFYIPEGTSICIYDSEDFTLKKRIGKKGEGPQEFLLNVLNGFEELFIDARTPVLMVNSMGKISFFHKKDGSFIGQVKSRTNAREYKPLGSGFAGQGMSVKNGIQYRSVNIYDAQLNKIKEVFRVRHHFQVSEGLRVMEATMKFDTYDNKLFVAWEKDFLIRVFDRQGKKLYSIKKDYRKVKFSPEYKEKLIDFFKTSKRYKDVFEMLKPKIIFPDTFPAVDNLVIENGKIYTVTFRVIDNLTEAFIFDIKGNYRGRVNLPLERREKFLPFPYTISEGRLYQLVEEGEHWRLKITELKIER